MQIALGGPTSKTGDLSVRAGLDLRLRRGRLVLPPDCTVEEDRVRRRGELAPVLADPLHDGGRRVEYRMLNGVVDGEAGRPSRLRYELTLMHGNDLGSEAAKTFGHVHVRPPGGAMGFPEVVEVVHGEVLFLIQDLRLTPVGPHSSAAWLVRARAGQWVILPPELAHVTIDVGRGPAVFSDVIDRRARGLYDAVAAAAGFAWYVGRDGRVWRNRRYVAAAPPVEIDAPEWSGTARGPLYALFRDDRDGLDWLSHPDRFSVAVPQVWSHVAAVIGRPASSVT